MKSSIFRLAVLAVVSLVVGAAGCSGCDNNEDGTNNGLDCPDGIIIQGECIRNNSDGGGDTDTPDASDAEDTDPTDTQPDPDGDGGTDIDGVCLPFDSRCASATSFETCDSDGEAWSAPQDCPADEVCNDGICVVGEQCTPGEVSGCRSPNSQRVCADDGVSYDERLCPSENPTCFDGECISGQCLPDAVFCDGQELKQCNSAGDGSTVQETCANGCLDGACLEPPDDECGGKSYIGCDFWAVDLDNYARPCSSSFDCNGATCMPNGICQGQDANSQQYAVTVSNTSTQNVDVEITDGAGSTVASRTVSPNALETFSLPEQSVLDSSLSNKSYRVQATGPVTVHQFNPETNVGVFSNDASLLLPSNALGKEYMFLGWPSLTTSAATSTTKSYVTIAAAESGTTNVTIETPVDILAGSGVSSMSAGSTETISMTEGQVLQLATVFDDSTEHDLTGMSITSDKNIAVFSAHECAVVPTNSPYCDHIEQQLLPINTWGSEYVSPKFRPRGQEADVFRVISATDGNQISTTPSISGADGMTLNAGEVLEFESKDSFLLTGTDSLSVGQFMVGSTYPGPENSCDPGGILNPFPVESNCAVTVQTTCSRPDGTTYTGRIGDPAFTINVPTNQFRKDYFVLTPEGYYQDWVSIVHPPGLTVNMDGSPVSGSTNRIPNTNWSVTWVEVQPGAHQFTANQPFGLYSHGYSCDVSYAYPGGLDLEVSP